MNPRIFIAIHYMHLGGAEMALLGLLQSLNPKRADIDLFVYSHEGELMRLIPDYVNLLPENKVWSMYEKPLKYVWRQGCFGMLAARLFAKFSMCLYVMKNHPKDRTASFGYTGKWVSKILPELYQYGNYDLAISFLMPHNYVLNHVCAKKKICWIHTDYSYVDVNTKLELPVWAGYDYIVSISKNVSESFLKRFPSLQTKIIEIENILSSDFVQTRSNQNIDLSGEMPKEEGIINLLSVGRLCEQKNFDNLPAICRTLLETGYNVKWYIIGFGPDENLIRQKIVEAGMQNHVILLGKKNNPYPYIKSCDIYVQPSRYEGKSVTVREAQMLCKPVVVTNYATAGSQIKDGIDGVIVPMDNEGCAKGIADFICDKAKQQRIIDYLEVHDYGNEKEVEKIYQLLDGC